MRRVFGDLLVGALALSAALHTAFVVGAPLVVSGDAGGGVTELRPSGRAVPVVSAAVAFRAGQSFERASRPDAEAVPRQEAVEPRADVPPAPRPPLAPAELVTVEAGPTPPQVEVASARRESPRPAKAREPRRPSPRPEPVAAPDDAGAAPSERAMAKVPVAEASGGAGDSGGVHTASVSRNAARGTRAEGARSNAAPIDADMADEPPSLVSDAQPRYPVAAAEDGIEADVTLMLTVTAEGRVRDAKLVRPAGADFDRAALAAAKQLRFRAARVDGLAVASRVRWICQFRLN